jgi:hypothetical protein
MMFGDFGMGSLNQRLTFGPILQEPVCFGNALIEVSEVFPGFALRKERSRCRITRREEKAACSRYFEVTHDDGVRLAVNDVLRSQNIDADRRSMDDFGRICRPGLDALPTLPNPAAGIGALSPPPGTEDTEGNAGGEFLKKLLAFAIPATEKDNSWPGFLMATAGPGKALRIPPKREELCSADAGFSELDDQPLTPDQTQIGYQGSRESLGSGIVMRREGIVRIEHDHFYSAAPQDGHSFWRDVLQHQGENGIGPGLKDLSDQLFIPGFERDRADESGIAGQSMRDPVAKYQRQRMSVAGADLEGVG